MAYVTATDYTDYFGGTAPTDFTRLELASTTLLTAYPKFPFSDTDFLALEEPYLTNCKYAILEQIKYLDSNRGYLDGVDGLQAGYRVGKYTKGDPITFNSNDVASRLAPMAVTYLNKVGYTYLGRC